MAQHRRATAATIPDVPDLQQFWDLALDILVLVANDGTFLHVNPAFTRVLGWRRDEVVGRTAFDFLHPDDVETTRAGFGVVAQPSASVSDFENRYRTSAGGYRTLRWNARSDSSGRLVHAVARDVTEANARTEALQLSEERFRRAMLDAAIGMAIVDLEGRFVEVNDALCRIVGRSAEELTQLTFQDITHPEDVDTDVELARQLHDGEISHYDLEKRYLHADGSVAWVLLTGSVVRNADGSPRHYIAQVQDVTARRHAEEQLARTLRELRQSNRTLEEFAAVAAHDLKTPLAVAIGAMELVQGHYSEGLPDDASNLLGRGVDQLRRLSRQVDGLLRVATTSSRTLVTERLDPCALAEEVRELLGDALAGTEVTCEAMPAVVADRAAMGLLLQNLLQNASTHGAGRVHLSGRSEDGRVRIEVDDDGPGIPADARTTVFDLFTRGATTHDGSGIGLALCRRIVERLGGQIGVSDAPLGGARIWLTLPAAAPEDQDEGRTARSGPRRVRRDQVTR